MSQCAANVADNWRRRPAHGGLSASKIGAALGDDSLVEYVAGLLVDAPDKEESGETIVDFLQSAGSLDEEAAREASEQLFTALQSAGFGTAKAGENDDNNNDDGGKSDASTSLLTKKVVMAAQDETSAWASGNAAGGGKSVLEAGLAAEKEQQSAMVVDAWGAGDPLRATNQRAEGCSGAKKVVAGDANGGRSKRFGGADRARIV